MRIALPFTISIPLHTVLKGLIKRHYGLSMASTISETSPSTRAKLHIREETSHTGMRAIRPKPLSFQIC